MNSKLLLFTIVCVYEVRSLYFGSSILIKVMHMVNPNVYKNKQQQQQKHLSSPASNATFIQITVIQRPHTTLLSDGKNLRVTIDQLLFVVCVSPFKGNSHSALYANSDHEMPKRRCYE